MTTTAIVIGAGPAGLAAANHLADAGAAVTVLESRTQLGGRASSEPCGPAVLNRGPHALYVGGAAKRELDGLGLTFDMWNPVSLAGSFLLTGPDTARRTPGGLRSIAALSVFAGRVLRGRPVDPALSVTEWLDAEVGDPAARLAAAALVRVTSFVADHDHFRAAAAAAQLKIGLAPGVRYLGAWQVLPDALAQRARARGVQIAERSAARVLERNDTGWRVLTDGDELRADVVVVAPGAPAAARRLLGAEFGAVVPEAPRAAEVGSLDLILRRLPRPRRRFALGTVEPHYAAIHSPKGADHVILSLAAYLTSSDHVSGSRERLERVADVLQPGWREELIDSRHLPRLTSVPMIPAPGGALPGGRPAVEIAGAPGLALAGDWVGPEGLLVDAALASGAAAARAVLADCGASRRAPASPAAGVVGARSAAGRAEASGPGVPA